MWFEGTGQWSAFFIISEVLRYIFDSFKKVRDKKFVSHSWARGMTGFFLEGFKPHHFFIYVHSERKLVKDARNIVLHSPVGFEGTESWPAFSIIIAVHS